MKAGIECGSKFLKIVIAGDNYQPITVHYLEHGGAPDRVLSGLIGEIPASTMLTGNHAGLLTRLFSEPCQVGEIEALLASLAHLGLRQKYVVNVGAGSMALIGRDDGGDFKSYRENNLCAAGTGSFIDEQMHRLGFGYDDAGALSLDPNPPVIATRCAVFAKSDLIHRQQEGHGPEGLWSGLCRGVVSTMLQSVFRGEIPEEEILFCGGLFLNPTIRYWTSLAVPGARYHREGHLLAAMGCLHLSSGGAPGALRRHSGRISVSAPEGGRRLELTRSVMPDFGCHESYDSGDCEVRVHEGLSACKSAALGIDIGSTSTKLVLVDAASGAVVLDIYARTGGNPVDATRRIFREAEKITGGVIEIAGCGTTGSGRKLVGAVTGADVIVNEITAHFRGARTVDPSIETIFEIGGQDSKYIRGRDGMVVDCNMNFVCAAGTGSFIEEQAGRLGFGVREIGPRVLGLVSPHASDRCTVFMEQDINKLLRESHSREEALASVILAIAKNYLNRVVGPRPVSGNKIFFQGATARNGALVAAFESLLDREIVVSPWCHVMGAFGAALIALEKTGGRSKFKGFRALEGELRLEYGRCGDCVNRCAITTAVFGDGTSESWGYLCGREGADRGRSRAGKNHFGFIGGMINTDAGRKSPRCDGNRGTIGIPAALSMFNYLPLWRTFLESLGFRVVTSIVSSPRSKERAVRLSKTDFCFPVKAALAHFEELSDNDAVDVIFFPSTISEKKRSDGLPRIFCPYVISCPSVAGALNLRATILSPVIDFRDRREVSLAELHRVFSPYGIGAREIDAAFRDGETALESFIAGRFDRGRRAIESARQGERKTVVFIGRPYNLYDTVINLNLPERFRHYGVDILPYELLLEPGAEAVIDHMYWNYGELILSAAEQIRGMENIFPVYLTNFSCGPDSFILSRFESIMEGKPYLIIELDEHGSETGYVTRIEAFIDIITEKRQAVKRVPATRRSFSPDWRGGRKLWIPPMHEVAARLFAAGFRAWGFDSEALPVEGSAAYEAGKRSIRGSECLPAATTIGAFLAKMRETGADPARQALFMPTAEGPCRFGQYAVLHRSILDRSGFGDTLIFSPSSVNSYMGMPPALRLYLWDIVIASDMIMKALCRVRPYELEPGAADRRADELIADLEAHIEGKGALIGATERAVSELFALPREDAPRPLVGVVGEIYVRCNPFCNNDLIRVIEAAGGEAWLSPISEWVLYTSWFENHITALTSRNPLTKLGARLKNGFMFRRERLFEEALGRFLDGRFEHHVEKVIREGEKYLPLRFEGEAILTLGRTELFFREGAALVVNCAPFGCMPGNITSALFGGIQEKHGKPVLTLFYDGESDANRAVEVYLGNIAAGDKIVTCGTDAL